MRITWLILLFGPLLHAQFDHQSVFPDLEEAALNEAIVDNFTPSIVLDLTQARDTLYRRVHFYNDSVRCVYSGLARFLDLDLDPSQALFGNGNNTDINLEHSYPRSKGAESGRAQSDMHHLFPTRVPVNNARASKPFAEINDNQTDSWFWRDITQSNPPNNNRDLFAEDNSVSFEPREDFKGDVARAAFYFYTIYRSEADGADLEFFDIQRSVLCDWHDIDPVDSLEWVRNEIIASYQDDKLNPFILDCRLARLYCDDILPVCRSVSNAQVDSNAPVWQIYPNPVSEKLTIKVEEQNNSKLILSNIQGQIIGQKSMNQGELEWPVSDLSPGIYFLTLHTADKMPAVRKIIIQ